MYRALGRLDDLQKEYDDPIAYFREYCKQLTEEEHARKTISVPIDEDAGLPAKGTVCDTKNVGYGILKQLYLDLKLPEFWNRADRTHEMKYSVERVFRFLVLSGALSPAFEGPPEIRDRFFEDYSDIRREDICDAPDIIAENREALQTWIRDHSEGICRRDMSVVCCTDFCCGPEQDKSPDADAGPGLLTDRNGIPPAFGCIPGGESDTWLLQKIPEASRSVCDRTGGNIRACCTVCFTALSLIRLPEVKLEKKYPAEQILESLGRYDCIPLADNLYQFTYTDDIIRACAEAFHLELDRKYMTLQEIRRLLRY